MSFFSLKNLFKFFFSRNTFFKSNDNSFEGSFGWMRILFLCFLIGAAAFSRLLPHPSNFTPLIAIALFSGCVFKNRWLAVAVPVIAMILSDFFIGFHSLSGLVYVAMIPAVFLGGFLQRMDNRDSSSVLSRSAFLGGWLGLGLSGDLIFFILTNLGVWWWSGFYEHSFSGWMECFTLALPFLKNQILGTLTYLGLLLLSWYGLMFLARQQSPAYKRISKD